MEKREENHLAPLATLSSVVPSLETSPTVLKENKKNEDDGGSAVTLTMEESAKDVRLAMANVDVDDDSSMSSSLISVVHRQNNKPKIPDGGWGWVVVLSSLVISMIADGISFSFGLLYIEFLHEFGASKSVTSWIGSLFMAVPLLTGPIMSALVDQYGCRWMTIVGGLISGVGFVISAYVKSIGVMYLTFGVIAGLGLGLCYVTAVVSVAFWFDKKRSLAVSLGACGTGIGTFVYAPMTQFFIEEYGWRGTTLLLAGTFFNMCVCGAVMRDPDWLQEQNNNKCSGGKSTKSSTCSVSGKSDIGDILDLNEIRSLLKNGHTTEYIMQTLTTSLQSNEDTKKKDCCRSVVNLPTFIKQNEKVPLEVLEQLSSNKKLYNVILENYPSLLISRSISDKGLNKIADSTKTTRVPVTFSMKLKKTDTKKELIHQQSLPEEPCQEPLLSKTPQKFKTPNGTEPLPFSAKRNFSVTNHNYLRNMSFHRNSIMHRGAMLNIGKYRLRASSCPDIYRNSMVLLPKDIEEKWYDETLQMFRGMVDFSLFLEFHFLLMSLSTILVFTWFIVPYFYLAEHMTRVGYSEAEASFIISVIGVANTIGMIVLGWAGDQPWMSVSKTFAGCLILCGVSCTALYSLSGNYIVLIVIGTCFGLFFASSFSFTPMLLVELVPLERFTTAYGLVLLCQGIGNLTGPPLAGMLFDVTQSWKLSFWQAGFWIIIAGLLILIIPYTKNRKIYGTGPVEKELEISEKESIA